MEFPLGITPSLCLLIVVMIIALLGRISTSTRSSRKRLLELIPGPPRLPLIGNLHQLSKMPHLSIQHLASKYGPLMYLQLGQVPTLFVSSPEIAKEVLETQDLTFCSRPPQSALRRIYYGGHNIAFTPYNDYWRWARKICTLELLTLKRVQSFASIREEELAILKGSIADSAANARPINLTEALVGYLSDVSCRQVFGKKFTGEGSCGKSRFHNLIHEFSLLMSLFNVGEFFPFVEWINSLTGLRRRFEANFKEMDDFLEEVVAAYRDTDGDCMVGVLLQLQRDSGKDQVPLTNESIKGILKDMFIAGTDSTSAVLEWTMSELLKNPRAMEKLRKELKSVVGERQKVEESDLPKMKYLNLVIKETLRLHPPATFLLPRETRRGCSLVGYEIPPETRVVINVWAMCKDKSLWGDDAEEFRPERFEENGVDYKGRHFGFLPFGSGRRGCPGIALAAVIVELTLANLVHAFEWSLPHGMSEEELDMEELVGIVLHRKVGLVANAAPRITGEVTC